MNPLTNMKNVLKLSERDLQRGGKSSWHDMYRDSAWIFVGGMPFDLTEGDIIAVFSQYGEIVNINLVRDKGSGKSKGFCFICYEDQRSTILAVDNLNGIKILNRSLRVDHVSDYKPPKENDKTDEDTRRLYMEGCAPKLQIPEENIKREQARTSTGKLRAVKKESDIRVKKEKSKKSKKEKEKKGNKEKNSKKKKKRNAEKSSSDESSSESESSSGSESEKETKKVKHRSRSKSPQKRKPENRYADRNRDEERRNKWQSRSRSRDIERRRRSRSR